MSGNVKRRLLVQSNHPEHRDYLKLQLEQLGHTVQVVEGEAQVLAELDKGTTELLLLDAENFALISKLKCNDNYCDLPIIVLAKADEIDRAEKCLEMGARDYLREPFNPMLLHLRVDTALQIKDWQENQNQREKMLKIEHDIEIARQIQTSFLPKEMPALDGWEIDSRFYPAREVAGDWYDAFYLANKRRIGFVVADVCDKGVGSAMFMAVCRSLVRSFGQQNYSLRWMDSLSDGKPSDSSKSTKLDALIGSPDLRRRSFSAGTTALKTAIEMVNNYVQENHNESNMFATLFYGVIDPSTGALSYVNGGHNPPILVDRFGNIKERLKPTGPAVGIFPGVEYGIAQTTMEPGDLLLTFTDGVPDAHDPSGALFTEKRLLSLVQQPASSALELLDRVDEGVHAHIGAALPFDDITMIAIRQKM